jgi:hypothetical protein
MIDWQGDQYEGKALDWDLSGQEGFEMSHCWDNWAQYEVALYETGLSEEGYKRDLETMSALRYERHIKDYMTQKTYYYTKLGLKGPD